MQPFTDLQWLDVRLQKLKLHLEELGSDLVYLKPQHKPQKPQFQDVEHHLEYTKPRIEDFKLNFRGLEPRVRTLEYWSQKLLVFGLIVLFVVPWLKFLQRGGSSSAGRRPESDNPVLNDTLEFVFLQQDCPGRSWLIFDSSFNTYFLCLCQIDWIEFSHFWTPPMLPTLM